MYGVAPSPPESSAAAAASAGLAVRPLFPPPFLSRYHAGWPNGALVCWPLCTFRGKYHSADRYEGDKKNYFPCEKPCATHVLRSSSRQLCVTMATLLLHYPFFQHAASSCALSHDMSPSITDSCLHTICHPRSCLMYSTRHPLCYQVFSLGPPCIFLVLASC